MGQAAPSTQLFAQWVEVAAQGRAHLEENAREQHCNGGEVHGAREDVIKGVEVGRRLHLQREEEDRGTEARDQLHEAARPHEGDEADE